MNIKTIEKRLSSTHTKLRDCGVAFLGTLIAQLMILNASHFDYTFLVIDITILMELALGGYFLILLTQLGVDLYHKMYKFLHHI